MNKLVIVESPSKSRTIEKYLGSGYKVTASMGHIMDLATSGKFGLGVDVENNFKPSYEPIKGKKTFINDLKKLSKNYDVIYLATDPDREGEAISWHLKEALNINDDKYYRVTFHEVTKDKIKEAFDNPGKINFDLVKSQETRRILDRIIGFRLSKLMQAKTSGVSAGRVQSVAVKLIVDREREILAFIPEEYWTITSIFKDFEAKLFKYKKDDLTIPNEEEADKIISKLSNDYKVESVEKKTRKRSAKLPFTTSSLQQESSNKLNFAAKRTMKIAQTLYEGVNLKNERVGLITYMRSDSTRLSDSFIEEANSYILKTYGDTYKGYVKKEKAKENVQDAHEGIRPTDINYTPESIMEFLDKDQFKLYNLIWQRFLVSQLAAMKYEQFEYILEKDKIEYRGTINKIIFDGYYKVFKEDEDLPIGDFPKIKEGDKFTLDKLDIKEDYTKPPARLTESSLVKTLEAEGIGRPSTYASIIDTLKKREYVKLQNKSFVPTEIGYEVKTQLDKFFPNIMNIKFTAKLEDELDEVDSGDKNWIDLLKVFYTELQKYEEKCKSVVEEELEKLVISDVLDKNGKPMIMKIGRFGRYLASQDTESKENISLKGIDISLEDIKKGKIFVKKQIEELSKKKEGQKTDIILDNGSRLLLKYGRFGAYLESENYKEDNIRKTIPKEIKTKIDNNTIKKENDILCLKDIFDKIEKEEAEILKKAGKCEKCGRPFKIKNGRWGKFLACTGYPECKNIKKISKDK